MLLIDAGEVAKGDWSPDHGTVVEVVEKKDEVTIKFVNGEEITTNKDEELMMNQGGRFDRES